MATQPAKPKLRYTPGGLAYQPGVYRGVRLLPPSGAPSIPLEQLRRAIERAVDKNAEAIADSQ